MFGLTFEKLFIVAVFTAVLIGPTRLPEYARRLAELVRAARRLSDHSRTTMRDDLGLPLSSAGWPAIDPRDYDPRRIVREAWNESTSTSEYSDEVRQQAATIRPGQQHIVTGSAAHPQRTRIATLAPHDPRRIAAQLGEPPRSSADLEAPV